MYFIYTNSNCLVVLMAFLTVAFITTFELAIDIRFDKKLSADFQEKLEHYFSCQSFV